MTSAEDVFVVEAGISMSDSGAPNSQPERSGGVTVNAPHGKVFIGGDVTGRDATTAAGNQPFSPAYSSAPSALSSSQAPWFPFTNREAELDSLYSSLTDAAGSHFFVILAAPQIGKTRLLEQLAARLQAHNRDAWMIRQVDLRKEILDIRYEANKLLECFFPELTPRTEQDPLKAIAGRILQSGKSVLCILDSTELLDEDCARQFRRHLSQISEDISKSGKRIWLSFVAATRGPVRSWKGPSPPPRFAERSLTMFEQQVVEGILRNETSERNNDWYATNAVRLQRTTKGMPALLVQYIQWMKAKDFVETEPIEEQDIFERLAKPYVRDSILSIDSLFRAGGTKLGTKRDVLETTLLKLSPYRLFRQANLEQILEADPNVKAKLSKVKWTVDDLWRSIGDTNLLQPADDPWRTMHLEIRNLLFRYQCGSTDLQVEAHILADEYCEAQLAGELDSKDLVAFLVERLWHQSEKLRLLKDPDAAQRLESFAIQTRERVYSRRFERHEIIDCIITRVMGDHELLEALESIKAGLPDRLIQLLQEEVVRTRKDTAS